METTISGLPLSTLEMNISSTIEQLAFVAKVNIFAPL